MRYNRLYKRGQLIDLHIHTQYSDGVYSVAELLKIAEQRGLDVISFTDHDVLCANYEVDSLKDKGGFSGKYVRGCEIAVSYNEKKYEVLAYDFDLEQLAKFEVLSWEYQAELERERMRKLVAVGKNLDFKVTPNLDFEIKYRTAHKCFFADLARHPENKILYDKYGVSSGDNLYRDHMIKPGSLFHCYNISEDIPTIELVCDKVHKAGGVAVFAHPFNVYGEKDPKQLVKDLHSLNILDGFESVHKKFTLEENVWMYGYCMENNLLATAGTDFHGDGFKVNGVRYQPECLGFNKYSQLETRFPIIKRRMEDTSI